MICNMTGWKSAPDYFFLVFNFGLGKVTAVKVIDFS